MSNVEYHGVTGAKRATWRSVNPRELLRRIIDGKPKADEAKWRESFWKEIEDDKDYLQAIVEYWLDNNLRSLSDPKLARRTHGLQKQAISSVKATVAQRIRTTLLELKMPNGKTLGNCTGMECAKFGGWLTEVGNVVPASTKVADHLSEDEVRKLWHESKP